MNAEELEKIVRRHEMQCLELKESHFTENCTENCADFTRRHKWRNLRRQFKYTNLY